MNEKKKDGPQNIIIFRIFLPNMNKCDVLRPQEQFLKKN